MSENLSDLDDHSHQDMHSKEPSQHRSIVLDNNENVKEETEHDTLIHDEEDPLDRCPPDFELCRKHRDANRVKDLDMRHAVNKDLNDEKMY